MKVRLYILTLLLLWMPRLFAQGVRFTASVGQSTVGTGEQLEVTFSVNANADNFNPPGFNGFQLLSGPNLSTSMTSINGNTSVSTSYSYVLLALREGDYTIGPAAIQVNGRRYTSNAVKIKVIKGHTIPQSTGGNNQMDNTAIESKAGDISKLIFIKAVVDKTRVYQGQQLTVSYRLYTRIGIDDSQINVLPELNGFFSQDIKNMQQQQRAQWSVETYKGARYNVTDIKQSILFPEHSGNLTIDPLGATFLVRQPVPSQDIMDSFFDSYKEVNVKLKSTPVIIHVDALPAGAPAGFSGAVGSFSIKAGVDKNRLKANEALNYSVTVTGTGNLKLLKNPVLSLPPGFEQYDPKVSDTITDNLTGESGSRKYNFTLIPRKQGNYTLSPLAFTYFNPGSRRYVTIKTGSIAINVAKGKEEGNVTSFASDRLGADLAARDIYGLKGNVAGFTLSTGFFGSAPYYLLLLSGPLACVAALIYRSRYRKLNSDEVKVKSRKAGKAASLRLASARQEIAGTDSRFYEEIFKALYGYLSDKLNIPYASLDKDNISAVLKAKGVNNELVNDVINTIDLCGLARFAPVNHVSKQDVFQSTKNIIDRLEEQVR